MKDCLESAWRDPRQPLEVPRKIGIAVMNTLGDLGRGASVVAHNVYDWAQSELDGRKLTHERNRQLLAGFAELSLVEQELRLTLLGGKHGHDLDILTGTPTEQ